MAFSTILVEYLDKLGCSNVELAKISHLDPSVISRYKSGKRVPSVDSSMLKSLATGMQNYAKLKVVDAFPDNIYDILKESLLEEQNIDENKVSTFQVNFSEVMDTLGITNAVLARYMRVDASYISRIRNNQRKPADLNEFSIQFANFVGKNYFENNKQFLLSVIEDENDTLTQMEFISKFATWLYGKEAEPNRAFANFLSKLDEFDLNDYINVIHFNDIKVPTAPLILPGSKKYYGIEEMRIGTVDFLKATVLSKNMSDVMIYNDMPVEELAKDMDFSKKWMMGLALMIKKGLNINCIHCVSRSFDELMLGLESWIPLYMTGQISPYYFKETVNTVFQHLCFTSGSAALFGECLSGYQNEGMYYLTKKHDEIDYYNKHAKQMLSKAEPLMQIYSQENREEYIERRAKDALQKGNRRVFLSAPSIYTMPENLLLRVLKRNDVSNEVTLKVMTAVLKHKAMIGQILENGTIHEIVPNLTKEQFEHSRRIVQFSDAFIDLDVNYTFEEYGEHIKAISEFAKDNPTYSYEMTNIEWFKNIQITIHEGECVIVSKNNSPMINFVISQPDLRSAFENMILPVVEQ